MSKTPQMAGLALLTALVPATAVAQAPATLTDQVSTFLVDDGWNPQVLEDGSGYRMNFQGDHDAWVCVAQVLETNQQVFFYSVLQRTIPAVRRDAVNQYLTRANHGMILGNFELDMVNGEMRYKTSIDVEGGSLSNEMIQKLIYTNVLMMNRYLLGVNRVVFKSEDPARALAWAESQPASTASSSPSPSPQPSPSPSPSPVPSSETDVYKPPKNPIEIRGSAGYGGGLGFQFLGDEGGDRTNQIGVSAHGSYGLGVGEGLGLRAHVNGGALYSLNNASSFGLGAAGGAMLSTSPGPINLGAGGEVSYDGYGNDTSSAYELPYALGAHLLGRIGVDFSDRFGIDGNWRSGWMFDSDRRGGGLALFDEAGFDAGLSVYIRPVSLRAGYMMQFNVAGTQQGFFVSSSF